MWIRGSLRAQRDKAVFAQGNIFGFSDVFYGIMPSTGRACTVKNSAFHIHHIPAPGSLLQPRDAACNHSIHKAMLLKLLQHLIPFSRRHLRSFKDHFFLKAKEQFFPGSVKSTAEYLLKRIAVLILDLVRFLPVPQKRLPALSHQARAA